MRKLKRNQEKVKRMQNPWETDAKLLQFSMHCNAKSFLQHWLNLFLLEEDMYNPNEEVMLTFFKIKGLSSRYMAKNTKVKQEIINHLIDFLYPKNLSCESLLHRNRKHQWTCVMRNTLVQLKKGNSTWLPILINKGWTEYCDRRNSPQCLTH